MAIAVPSFFATLVYVLAAVAFHARHGNGVDAAVLRPPHPPHPPRPSPQPLHPVVVGARRAVGVTMAALTGDDAGLSDVRGYEGSLYGVSASVTLDFAERRADVTLWGVPIGGRVDGFGWLAAGADALERGAVVLDEALQGKLDRRFVRVVDAALDRKADTVTVCVDVPIFGEQRLVLQRKA